MTWLKHFFSAPVFDDADKTRSASLLHVILLVLLATSFLLLPILTLINVSNWAANLGFGAVMVAMCLALMGVSHRGHVRFAGGVLSLGLLGIMTLNLYGFGGIRGITASGYFLVIIIAGLLLGARAALIFGGLSILCVVGIFYVELAGVITGLTPEPAAFGDLFILAFLIAVVSALLLFAVRSIDAGFQAARRSALALTDSNRELQASRNALEARTYDLERRSVQLRAAAEVGRAAASVHTLDRLLPYVVRLISDQFDFYHVGLFMLEESGRSVVLRAASSEGGRQMLAQGHRLAVGQQGIVGYVAGSKEPRIALDVGQDALHFDNPFLPQTHSEMAVPLIMNDQLLGVLDVQSDQPAAFTQDDVTVLSVVADQVAMAISNARLLEQVQETVEAERSARGQITRASWAQLFRARQHLGYRCDSQGVARLTPAQDQARTATGPLVQADAVTLPVKVREQAVGAVKLRKQDADGEWTPEEIALVEMLAEQLGVALESARLYQDTQRRAAQEQLSAQVTARMRESLDMETVLRTAVNEMRQALGLEGVVVQLARPEAADAGDEAEMRQPKA